MEMHLEATRAQTVRIGEQSIAFAAGETIHTESSRKFTEASVASIARAAGWMLAAFEVSEQPSVALALLSS
jgi:uncharacterized SAM-dependent methyltransferase